MLRCISSINRNFARSILMAARPLPGLDQPIEGLPTLKKIDQSKQPEVEITTLENGVRVVSTETADIIASLGVILDFGSSYEKPKEYGCTQLLQKLLFKASKQHSTEMIANSFSELGDPFSSYVSKESCSFIFNTYPDHIQDVLALYKECLESPYFDRQLIEECGNIIELENQTFYLSNTFDTFIEDITHAAIYGIRSANGHKLRQDPTKLRSIAPQTLYEFYERNMSYKNLVYCASGVNHKEFVEAIQKNMPTLTSKALSEPTPDMLEMKGPGYIEEDRTKDKVHVGVSINTGSWRDPNVFAIMLLQTLLGGGSSFSSGGPGKGMFSKLYMDILYKYSFVESAQVYVTPLKECGCTSIVIQVPYQYASSATQMACNEFHQLALGEISDEEFSRAKNRLIAIQLMNRESRQILCEDLGRQISVYNSYNTSEYIINSINKLKKDDIVQLIRTALTKPIGFSAFGPNVTGRHSCVPPIDLVQQYMHKDNWKI